MAELRPEVAEALREVDAETADRYDGMVLRKELQRFTDENARLQNNNISLQSLLVQVEAERDALRKQIPTVDELHALERCHKSQEVLRAQLDKANPDDPYASLMVEEDAMLLAGLIERFHAAQR